LSYAEPADEEVNESAPRWPDPLDLEEESRENCHLRKSYSLQHARRANFSLKHKLRKHLSQKGPARMDLGKINETFTDGTKGECEPLAETVMTSQTRHRSLDIRALEGNRDGYPPSGRGKLSLPDNFSSHFPVISLLSGGMRLRDFDGDTTSSGSKRLEPLTEQENGYLHAATSVDQGKRAVRQRPQSCCIYKVEPEPLIRGIRVNSLFEKFNWDGIRSSRSNGCKSHLEHDMQPLRSKSSSRNSDSPNSEAEVCLSTAGMASRQRSKQGLLHLQRTSSAETGLNRGSNNDQVTDIEVTRTGVRLKPRSDKPRSKSVRHCKGSSFRRRGDKRWSYIEMTEFSSSENGTGAGTPDCSESTRLTACTPSTGGATFGSDRSYTSSTMTILKSFEELHDTEPAINDIRTVTQGPEREAACFTLEDNQMPQTNNRGNENGNLIVRSADHTPDLPIEVTEVTTIGNDQVIHKEY
jgi:hypothetical protein